MRPEPLASLPCRPTLRQLLAWLQRHPHSLVPVVTGEGGSCNEELLGEGGKGPGEAGQQHGRGGEAEGGTAEPGAGWVGGGAGGEGGRDMGTSQGGSRQLVGVVYRWHLLSLLQHPELMRVLLEEAGGHGEGGGALGELGHGSGLGHRCAGPAQQGHANDVTAAAQVATDACGVNGSAGATGGGGGVGGPTVHGVSVELVRMGEAEGEGEVEAEGGAGVQRLPFMKGPTQQQLQRQPHCSPDTLNLTADCHDSSAPLHAAPVVHRTAAAAAAVHNGDDAVRVTVATPRHEAIPRSQRLALLALLAQAPLHMTKEQEGDLLSAWLAYGGPPGRVSWYGKAVRGIRTAGTAASLLGRLRAVFAARVGGAKAGTAGTLAKKRDAGEEPGEVGREGEQREGSLEVCSEAEAQAQGVWDGEVGSSNAWGLTRAGSRRRHRQSSTSGVQQQQPAPLHSQQREPTPTTSATTITAPHAGEGGGTGAATDGGGGGGGGDGLSLLLSRHVSLAPLLQPCSLALPYDAPLEDAHVLLRHVGLHSVPVVRRSTALVGVVTRKDLEGALKHD